MRLVGVKPEYMTHQLFSCSGSPAILKQEDRVNQTATKKVKVVNHSPIPVVFSVSVMPSSSVPALQAEGVISVSPSEDISLQPNAIKEIEIMFSPKSRVTQFSEEVR